jgi:hypothetical protein
VRVRTDPALAESEAILEDAGGRALARVLTPRGSPGNPLDAAEIAAKAHALAGGALDGLLDDESRPAKDLRGAAGL